VARGHEQEVAAGEQAARFGFVETDTRGDLPGIASGKLAQLFFDGGFAAAEDRQLATGLDDVPGDADGQVQAFLADQSRHYGKQRAVARRQAKMLAYMGGVGRLARPVMNAEALDQVWIVFRLPALVDAIDQAAEQTLAGLHAQEAFHAAAELGR